MNLLQIDTIFSLNKGIMTSIFTINPTNALLDPVKYKPSSHYDERPEDAIIDMIVIHSISLPPGNFGTNAVEKFFCGELEMTSHAHYSTIIHLRVASHLFIKRTGEIIQFVPFTKRAWHAGESFFAGKTHCNDFSIGIELEGSDDIPYEQVQYQQLGHIIPLLMRYYPAIRHDRIVGHADIAPGRKTDPGPAFDWAYLKGMLA